MKEAGQRRLQSLVQRLRQRGFRVTPQRLTVLRLLLDGEHPTAGEVYQRLRALSPTTSRATVYKTVDVLRQTGEVLEIQVPDLGTRFDVLTATAHPHYICTHCGVVSDVEGGRVTDFLADLQARAPGPIDDWRVDLFGLCETCQHRQGVTGG